jgi:hypothetical protein
MELSSVKLPVLIKPPTARTMGNKTPNDPIRVRRVR